MQPLSWGDASNWGYMSHSGFFMCFVLLFSFFFSLAVLFVFLSFSPFSPGLEMWLYCQVNLSGRQSVPFSHGLPRWVE